MEFSLLFDYFNSLANFSKTWPIGTHTILNKDDDDDYSTTYSTRLFASRSLYVVQEQTNSQSVEKLRYIDNEM